MAVIQRTWIILLRPYYGSGDRIIHYTGVAKAGIKTDLGNVNATYDTATALKGEGVGMEEWNTTPYDKGGWVEWYTSTSYERIREKMKECIEEHGKQYVKLVEVIPTDIMITPFS